MSELISVIVPIYNVENYLKECINSIINQIYRNLEIILIDDGSTDLSGKICDEYALIDKRIQVIHQNNKGLSGARNRGLEAASGSFISFIDSDDIIHPAMLSIMIDRINDNDILECGVQTFIDEKNLNTIKSDFYKPDGYMTRNKMDALKHLVETPGMSSSFCNKLFRAELFTDIRFMEGIIHEDEQLIFRILDHAHNCGYINNPFYYYRTRPDSIMNTQVSLKQLDAVYVWEDRYNYCKEKGYTELMLRTQATLYYECCNLYKKKFFKKNIKAKAYLLDMIEKYRREFIRNPYIKKKHRIVLFCYKLYKYIF